MKALDADVLYKTCDLSKLNFETTDELEELTEIAGQDRAIRYG